MIGDKFALAVVDIDDAATRSVEAVVASANTEQLNALGSIVIPTAEMAMLLRRLQTPQSRLWVVDADNRVVGLTDSLNKPMALPVSHTEERSFFSNSFLASKQLAAKVPGSRLSGP